MIKKNVSVNCLVTPRCACGVCGGRQAGGGCHCPSVLCHCRALAGHQTQVVCLTAHLEFFFCCWSSRRMTINETCGQLLSTVFWDHIIKLTGKFACPVWSICVVCCRYVHMPSCQKMCIYCLYCLSLGKRKNKAMHLL